MRRLRFQSSRRFCIVSLALGLLSLGCGQSKQRPADQETAEAPAARPGPEGVPDPNPDPSPHPQPDPKTDSKADPTPVSKSQDLDPVSTLIHGFSPTKAPRWDRRIKHPRYGELREVLWELGAEQRPQICAAALAAQLKKSFGAVQTLPGSETRLSFRAQNQKQEIIAVCGLTLNEKNAAHIEVRRRSSADPKAEG